MPVLGLGCRSARSGRRHLSLTSRFGLICVTTPPSIYTGAVEGVATGSGLRLRSRSSGGTRSFFGHGGSRGRLPDFTRSSLAPHLRDLRFARDLRKRLDLVGVVEREATDIDQEDRAGTCLDATRLARAGCPRGARGRRPLSAPNPTSRSTSEARSLSARVVAPPPGRSTRAESPQAGVGAWPSCPP